MGDRRSRRVRLCGREERVQMQWGGAALEDKLLLCCCQFLGPLREREVGCE
uniref:Uncharacterized protein MANES_08G066900 n=1 Tax=Rhizophora mucronata TaxID=61149 RepID=A0A2P2JSS9_RHIMU